MDLTPSIHKMGIKNPRVSLSGVFVGLWSNHLNYSLLLPIGIIAYIFAKFNIQSVFYPSFKERLQSEAASFFSHPEAFQTINKVADWLYEICEQLS